MQTGTQGEAPAGMAWQELYRREARDAAVYRRFTARVQARLGRAVIALEECEERRRREAAEARATVAELQQTVDELTEALGWDAEARSGSICTNGEAR